MPPPPFPALWHRGQPWTSADVARLIVREGGGSIADAARATRLDPAAVLAALRRPSVLALHPSARAAFDAVRRGGCETAADIADALGVSPAHANQLALDLYRFGVLDRSRYSGAAPYVYHLPRPTEHARRRAA